LNIFKDFYIAPNETQVAFLNSTGKGLLLRKQLGIYFICTTYLFRSLCLGKSTEHFAMKKLCTKSIPFIFPRGKTSKALLSKKDRISKEVLHIHDFKLDICRKRKI
jgi:hypothetical protein